MFSLISSFFLTIHLRLTIKAKRIAFKLSPPPPSLYPITMQYFSQPVLLYSSAVGVWRGNRFPTHILIVFFCFCFLTCSTSVNSRSTPLSILHSLKKKGGKGGGRRKKKSSCKNKMASVTIISHNTVDHLC